MWSVAFELFDSIPLASIVRVLLLLSSYPLFVPLYTSPCLFPTTLCSVFSVREIIMELLPHGHVEMLACRVARFMAV